MLYFFIVGVYGLLSIFLVLIFKICLIVVNFLFICMVIFILIFFNLGIS